MRGWPLYLHFNSTCDALHDGAIGLFVLEKICAIIFVYRRMLCKLAISRELMQVGTTCFKSTRVSIV